MDMVDAGLVLTPRKDAVGPRGHLLDEKLVRWFELYIPDHANSQHHACFHCNCGFVTAEIDDEMGQVEVSIV